MPETIGQQLNAARAARRLTLEKVTQATHIQPRLLEALEADDFESLPSPVQARAFLKLYASFLGLSLDDMVARQREDTDGSPADLLSAEVISTPDQEPVIVQADPVLAGPADEIQVHKPEFIQAGLSGFFHQLRQNLPKPKSNPVPVESGPSGGPAKLETGMETQIEPLEEQIEEPGVSAQEEHFQSDNLPSESQESQLIFAAIGGALRQRREALSLTLEEVENQTHVRKHYLQALELGDFDHLPSSVQTRGMLNNYARFLDMDVDAILTQFAEGLQTQRLERQPSPLEDPQGSNQKIASRTNLQSPLRRYVSMDILAGGGLILILLVFAVWGTSRIIGLRSAITPQSTAQSISDVLAASAGSNTLTPTLTKAETEPFIPTEGVTVIGTVPAAGPGPVQVVIVALQQAYLRVSEDGKIQFDGRVATGNAYSFSANNQIEVLTGNGAAISILYNQSDLGQMGRFGQVVDRIYTASAILNPTATSTPTPTISPTPTVTPRFSPTPSQTNTPFGPPATPK